VTYLKTLQGTAEESDASNGWSVYFNFGSQTSNSKTNSRRVRAFRRIAL
jgi:hypothetical protein